MGPGSGNFGYNGDRNSYQSGNNPYYWRAGREHWQYPKGPRRPDNGEGCLKGCLSGLIGAIFGILWFPLLLIAAILLLLLVGNILYVGILLVIGTAIFFYVRKKRRTANDVQENEDQSDDQPTS